MNLNKLFKDSFLCTLLFSAICVNTCKAQSKIISLKDALNLAESNYPLIKAKADYTRAAEYDVKATRREFIPQLKLHEQLDYGTTNAIQGTYFTLGVIPSISAPISTTNQYNPVYGSVSLAMAEWAPYTFGSRNAKLAMAQSSYKSVQADEQNAKLQYQLALIQSYLNLIVLQRFTNLQTLNIERTSQVLSVVRAASRSGIKSGADSTFTLAEASKARLSYYDAFKNEQSQKILLSELIGLNNTDFAIDTNSISNEGTLNLPITVNHILDHPLAVYYKSRVEMADAKAKYTQRTYWPQLKLLAYTWGRGSGLSPDNGQRYQDFNDGTSLKRFNYAFGAALTFNILDYPRIRASYNAELQKQDAIAEEYKAGIAEIEGKQAIADVRLDAAKKQVAEAPVQFSAAKAAYEQMNARYKSGIASLVDLTQSLYNLNRAETDVTIAYSNYWQAILYKAAVSGDITYFTQHLK
jgi:outer membrane protein TolC